MKVAIVHDYLIEYGGAERVVEALHNLFPDAPIYTAFYDPQSLGLHSKSFQNAKIYTSFIQKIPFARQLISALRIIAPLAFASFNLSKYDVVISSSAIYFAKAVRTNKPTVHLAYIHTPPRYLYGYTTTFNYKKNPIIRFFAEIANYFLRIIDFQITQQPDLLIANSENVSGRISKIYHRKSQIIYPPIEVSKIEDASKKIKPSRDYFLVLTRLWGAKGLDLIVDAFNNTDLHLKIVGSGPLRESLQQKSRQNISFLGHVSDEERINLLANAKAIILAAEDEDFGITAVESMAAGTPVIALRQGGYLETVVPNKTGIFFDKSDPNSLLEAIDKFEKTKFSSTETRRQASNFSVEKFNQKITDLIRQNLPT